MKERLSQNSGQLNQRAKHLLEQAKQLPGPDHLYLVQLMHWALEERKDGLRGEFRDRIESMVSTMLGHDPAQVMKFLVQGDSPRDVRLSRRDLQGLNPSEAANVLLESLHGKMQATMPSYRPLSQE